jgi:hypothetical protein
MTRLEQLEKIAGGTCDGIECGDCLVRPFPGGGCDDCFGDKAGDGPLNLPFPVRAHARSLLAAERRIAGLESANAKLRSDLADAIRERDAMRPVVDAADEMIKFIDHEFGVGRDEFMLEQKIIAYREWAKKEEGK